MLLLILSALGAAAKTQTRMGDGDASDASVAVQATVFADSESVKQAVGDDLGGHYIVVRVKVSPKSKIPIQLDDFLLKTDKDGERSHPFVPTQIAGQGVLVVREVANGGGGGRAQGNDPQYGGIGGIGFPGSGGSMGNAASTTGAQAKMKQEEKENPLVATLGAKMLQEKETAEPVTGLLYFPMEKQKVKDLELRYTTPAGKLIVRFHQ